MDVHLGKRRTSDPFETNPGGPVYKKHADMKVDAEFVKKLQAMDYFERLGVTTRCTTEDVRSAYRYYSIAFHPDKNRNNAEVASELFKLIGEAHSTLIDAQKRMTYVEVQRLKKRSNPFAAKPDDLLSRTQEALRKVFQGGGGQHSWGAKRSAAENQCKPAPRVHLLPVTLEKMDKGAKICYEYTQTNTSPMGNRTCNRYTTIMIPPGATDGERIVQPAIGDHFFGMAPGDLVFILQQEPHRLFSGRNGCDLFLEKKINPLDMITGFKFAFVTVSEDVREVMIDPPLRDGQQIVIEGAGMRKRGLAQGNPDDERGNVILTLKLESDAPAMSKEQIEMIQRMAADAMKKQ